MKKYVNKSISLILVASMTAWGLAGCSQAEKKEKEANDVKVEKSANTDVEALLSSKVASADKGDKKETVFVEMDADGNVTNTTVSDTLKVSGKENISDDTTLDDIKNISGDEQFTKNSDGSIVWENKGKDITYQGTTTKQAPIGMDVNYTLDGKEMSAKEIARKSGKVTIKYSYTNKAKTDDGKFVPFLILTGMVLNEQFTNVEVENGKVIEHDGKDIVVGYSVPGLKDYLIANVAHANKYIGDIELPEEVTITADVKDFSMDMTLSVATSQIGDLDLTDSLDFSDIERQMDQLQNGTDQIVDGAGKLNDGTGKLKDGSSKLKNGADQLKSGTDILYSGTSELLSKYKKFNDAVISGASEINNGTKKLYKGSKNLESGAKSADTGAKKIAAGLHEAKAGFEDTKDSQGLVSGSESVAGGITEVKKGVKKLVSTLQGTPDSIQTQIDGVIGQVSAATGGAISSEAALNSTVQKIEQAVKGGYPLETVLTNNGLNASTYYALMQAYYSVQTLESVKSTFETQISGSAKDIKELTDGLDQLETGAGTLSGGVKKLYAGIKQLSSGADELADDKSGLGALASGASKVKEGLNTLQNGTDKMDRSLSENSPKIQSGIEKLDSGAGSLDNGAESLSDGAGKLDSGITTLADGVKTLKDGVIKLDNEGIKKITSIFKDDAPKAIDTLEEILNNGKAYRSFGGIKDDMSGSVKFIFKTQEIEAQ